MIFLRPAWMLIVFSLCSLVYTQVANYKFRHVDISNGLSNNQVRSIHVDRYGYAWFGTISGLNRYDGYSFKVYKNHPGDSASLAFNQVYQIFEDSNGLLWFFSHDSNLSIFDPVSEQFSSDHELFHLYLPVSKTYISDMILDRDSNMWIANSQFGLYFYDPVDKKIERLCNKPGDDGSLHSDRVLGMTLDSQGHIWLVNQFGVVEKINITTHRVEQRISFEVKGQDIESQRFRLFVDRDDDIWMFSDNDETGLYFYETKSKRFIHFQSESPGPHLNSDLISGIEQDEKGVIWVGTDHGGVNLIDKRGFNITFLKNDPGVDNSLSQNSVTTVYKDKNGIIWVGTYKNGVNFYHPNLFQFGLERHYPSKNDGLPANDIDCFAEDVSGNLWIGTNGSGLIYFDRQNKTYRRFQHQPDNPNSLSNDIIVNLCYDSNQLLWIGTYFGGLNCYDGKRFKRFMHNPADPRSISDNRIWQIFEDSQKRLWIGTLGSGLDLYDPKTDRFLHYRSGDVNSIHSDFVLSLEEDSQGQLWIGTSNGVDVLNHQTGRFTQYLNSSSDPNSIGNNVILSIYEDSRNWIWIGTRNGLNLYLREKDSFRSFAVENGLPDNNIISILEDKSGHIWLSTLNGLSNIRIGNIKGPDDFNYVIKNYDVLDGLQGKEFNEHAAFRTRKGELLFGGVNGYNLFLPETIADYLDDPEVVLTDFKLHNKTVLINESINGRIILNKAIHEQNAIELKHNQNVFSIEFSAMHFLNPEKMQYKYMLEGFNSDWITTDAFHRNATYTNLNPGRYVFRIKASNGNGVYGKHETKLIITVIPPFYSSKLAFVFYFVFLLLLILLLIRIIVRREHLKFARKQERIEHQRMHELDAMKIRFFTNVSHEFRTPLTLILTPLEKLIRNAVDPDVKNQLVMIQRNGKRLLNLVNQLLDFRKMEMHNIQVNLSYGNIIRFLRETTDSFTDLSESKNIDFKFESSIGELFTFFDQDKIEKVFFNLLSNAFKFTSSGGSIRVFVDLIKQNKGEWFEGEDYIEVRVADTGIGISRDKHERIFDRFFQSDNTGTLVNQGSGIGLSLTQEFVRLHKGTIRVESEPEKGATFIVRLPLINDGDRERSIPASTSDGEIKAVSDSVEEVAGPETQVDMEQKRPTLMIVEDNEDLRFYLKENLKELYQIVEAENGRVGLEKVRSIQPNLIVSDVMMPVMDGLELCRKIKSDPATSHIPVILLSARSANEQKLEGLESGADDYVTKPFNYEILEIKIRKLIEQRQTFQKSLHLQYEIKPGEIGITSLDEKFIQKALTVVEKNISNADFSVERMSKELGVSRGHLYNKILALTGKTPIEFIRIMRLKRAAQYLGKSQMTVAEIAFEVGFNDPKYFSKYFRDEFKMSPSEYARKMMKS